MPSIKQRIERLTNEQKVDAEYLTRNPHCCDGIELVRFVEYVDSTILEVIRQVPGQNALTINYFIDGADHSVAEIQRYESVSGKPYGHVENLKLIKAGRARLLAKALEIYADTYDMVERLAPGTNLI